MFETRRRSLPLVLMLLALLSACGSELTPPVATDKGAVVGVKEQGVSIYRGIPYAAPPVGELRWRAPQPAIAWNEARRFDEFGPACWQITDSSRGSYVDRLIEGSGMSGLSLWLLRTGMSFLHTSVSEDCLTLNIVSPQGADGLPVMVWIHGGSHQTGSGGTNYESPDLALNGVVLVTINYRLGLYGFMAHPELATEDPNGSSGNYGMLDQIAALAWVRDNIAAFGGDSNNVTIFGESAGGHSVGQLMASPLSHGLFHRAIAQSGSGFYRFQATEAAHESMSGFDAGRRAAQLAGVAGDNEIAALRAMSTAELKDIADDPAVKATLHPQIDGYVLAQPTAHIFDQGRQAPVPLLLGSNADEGSVLYQFGYAAVDGGPLEQPTTISAWETLLAGEFPDNAEAVAAAYTVDTDADVVKAAEQLMGDTRFGRNSFYMAQAHSAAGHPTYLYFYERRSPSETETIGASHALEIAHVFGGLIPLWPTDERDPALAAEMQAYWTHFARTGDPNRQGLPDWPRFADSEPTEMAFGHEQTAPRPVLREKRYRAMRAQLARRIQAVVNGSAVASE